MVLPRTLLAHLHQLAADVDDRPTALTGALTNLATDLGHAVSGYAGVTVTVVQGGHPVVITALVPDRVATVATSLGLPLRLLTPACEDGSRAVFYSATPGSLVDLAADLRHVLSSVATPRSPLLAPELDVDLPPVRTSSGVSGLTELATINRAVGVLLEQGHDPDAALVLLRQRARVTGVPVHVVAAELLRF